MTEKNGLYEIFEAVSGVGANTQPAMQDATLPAAGHRTATFSFLERLLKNQLNSCVAMTSVAH